MDVTFSPEDLGALRVTLQDLGDKFGVVIIESPLGQQGEVLDLLQRWEGENGVPNLAFADATGCASVVSLLHLAAESWTRCGVLLFGLEGLTSDQTLQALSGLNFGRDTLSRFIRGPLVLVADPDTLRVISERLPDFYSWRIFETSVSPAV